MGDTEQRMGRTTGWSRTLGAHHGRKWIYQDKAWRKYVRNRRRMYLGPDPWQRCGGSRSSHLDVSGVWGSGLNGDYYLTYWNGQYYYSTVSCKDSVCSPTGDESDACQYICGKAGATAC